MTENELVLPEDPLVVAECAGMVVLSGSEEAIERFRSGRAELAHGTPLPRKEEVARATGMLGAAASVLTSLAPTPGSSQVLFQLDPKGLAAFREGRLAQASVGDGYLRAFSLGGSGIDGHAAIKPITMAPQQLLSAQMALTTVALTAAIKEVQAAVERVERKLEKLNDLLESVLAGEVIGTHAMLDRRATQVLETGAMADADWTTIQSAGLQVEQQIETIRTFARKRVRAATEEGAGIGDRRDAIEYVGELTEVLALLSVAQHSLFLFQAARLTRLRDHEPNHLDAALAEAVELLGDHRQADQELIDLARGVVAERSQVKALEVHRFLSGPALHRLATAVDEDLTWFSEQRTLDYEPVTLGALPTPGDALDEVRDRGGRAIDTTKAAADGLRSRFKKKREPKPELPPGEAPPF